MKFDKVLFCVRHPEFKLQVTDNFPQKLYYTLCSYTDSWKVDVCSINSGDLCTSNLILLGIHAGIPNFTADQFQQINMLRKQLE